MPIHYVGVLGSVQWPTTSGFTVRDSPIGNWLIVAGPQGSSPDGGSTGALAGGHKNTVLIPAGTLGPDQNGFGYEGQAIIYELQSNDLSGPLLGGGTIGSGTLTDNKVYFVWGTAAIFGANSFIAPDINANPTPSISLNMSGSAVQSFGIDLRLTRGYTGGPLGCDLINWSAVLQGPGSYAFTISASDPIYYHSEFSRSELHPSNLSGNGVKMCRDLAGRPVAAWASSAFRIIRYSDDYPPVPGTPFSVISSVAGTSIKRLPDGRQVVAYGNAAGISLVTSTTQGRTWGAPVTVAAGYQNAVLCPATRRGLLFIAMQGQTDLKWYLSVGTLGSSGTAYTFTTPTAISVSGTQVSGLSAFADLQPDGMGGFVFIYSDMFGNVQMIRCRKLSSAGVGTWTV